MTRQSALIAVLFAAIIALTSCTKEQEDAPTPAPKPEPTADYTIMLYGCGGGNLDGQLLANLKQVVDYGYTPKVNFTAKVKFSNDAQKKNPELYGGTRLYNLTESGLEQTRVAGAGFRLDDPQNIADFIIDAKQRMPAKQYILVLWNHGSAFEIIDQLPESSYPEKEVASRSVLYDDITGESISIFELEEGLKRTNDKLDLVYCDLCLAGGIENICQIKSYTRYFLGASHTTPGRGGHYTVLMHSLANHPQIIRAMEHYVPTTVLYWISERPEDTGHDLVLSDMRYVDAVTKAMKECITGLLEYRNSLTPGSQDELSFHYNNGTRQKSQFLVPHPYYSEGGELYFFSPTSRSADLLYTLTRLSKEEPTGKLTNGIAKLKTAIEQMTPLSYNIPTSLYPKRISVGLIVTDKATFEKAHEGYTTPTLAGLYHHLNFEKETGWSRFLETNVRKKVGYRFETNPSTGELIDEYYEIQD